MAPDTAPARALHQEARSIRGDVAWRDGAGLFAALQHFNALRRFNIDKRYGVLIDKRCGRIDNHTRAALRRPINANSSPSHAATHNTRDTPMTANKLTTLFDQVALNVINAIVLIGLPLAAFGLFAHTL